MPLTVPSPILEIRDVSCELCGREILRHVDLTVEEGETVVLLGRSGSGKTTLLKMVNGLVPATCGEIRFEGRAAAQWNAVAMEANIGLVPRLEKWEPARVAARVESLLNTVGLPPAEFRKRYPRELSGGQRQRVGIARALGADPPLLLFDEPFASLDPITRYELQREFLDLRHTVGKTALFVTHDVREALLLASRIALLHDGALELVATPAEFLAATTPEARAFLASLEAGGRPN
jgi:osmoprotectant transport system ATP-binding protein